MTYLIKFYYEYNSNTINLPAYDNIPANNAAANIC